MISVALGGAIIIMMTLSWRWTIYYWQKIVNVIFIIIGLIAILTGFSEW